MDYITEQTRLEAEAVVEYTAKYRDNLRIRGVGETKPGQRMLAAVIEPFAAIIKEQLEHASRVKRGAKSAIVPRLRELSPEQLALITIRTAMQSVTERKLKHIVAKSIGTLVAENAEWNILIKEKGGLAHVVTDQLKKTAHEQHRRKVTRHVLNTYQPERRWTEDEMRGAGEYLLKELLDTGLLLESQSKYNAAKKKTTMWIVPTEATMKLLDEGHARCELLDPILAPMVCKPRRWDGLRGGAYLTRDSLMVKTTNDEYLRDLAGKDMPEIYSALNNLQETAYCVNKSVLGVLSEAWEHNDLDVPGMIDREPQKIPAAPADFETNEEAAKDWKRRAAKIHEQNADLVSKRYSVLATVNIATKYSQYPELYFPHAYDWRGRVYPMPVYMHPQADDLAKSLLKFAEGKPLGVEGVEWVKVHIANLFGVDKVSLVERRKWVDDNLEGLLANVAGNPRDVDAESPVSWKSADKPWQALAACFELAGIMMMGEDYVSHLPIAMDGTCNGLQHLSAMLLDEKGGTATNLVAGDKPNDIYTEVLDVVIAKLEARKAKGDEEAELLLDMGLKRLHVKQPVMTTPYGVTAKGMLDQIKGLLMPGKKCDMGERMRDEWAELESCGKRERAEYCAARELSKVVEQAVGEVVLASAAVMNWMQDVAKVAAAAGNPLRWTTPTGLMVLQDYRKQKSRTVRVTVGTHRLAYMSMKNSEEINPRKQAQSISPNIIHSLDAAHMVKTVNACAKVGINSFAMVHDSYATHAADVGSLSKILRDEFVGMYSKDVLNNLFEQFVSQVEPEVAADFPPVPQMGTLDIHIVNSSPYFFA